MRMIEPFIKWPQSIKEVQWDSLTGEWTLYFWAVEDTLIKPLTMKFDVYANVYRCTTSSGEMLSDKFPLVLLRHWLSKEYIMACALERTLKKMFNDWSQQTDNTLDVVSLSNGSFTLICSCGETSTYLVADKKEVCECGHCKGKAQVEVWCEKIVKSQPVK